MSMVESIPRTPNRRMNTEKNKTPGPFIGVGICPLYSASALTMSASLTHSSISVTCRSLFSLTSQRRAMCVGLS